MPQKTFTKAEMATLRRKVRSFLTQGYDVSETAIACKCPRVLVTKLRDEWRKEFRKAKQELPPCLWNKDDPEVKRRLDAMAPDPACRKASARAWASGLTTGQRLGNTTRPVSGDLETVYITEDVSPYGKVHKKGPPPDDDDT